MSEPQPADSQPDQPIAYESPQIERPASAAPTESILEYESPASPLIGRHDPYAALRLRDYRLFSAGWVLAVIGQQIQAVAVGWDVFNRTRDEAKMDPLLALGLVGAVLAIPLIVLAIPAGAIADRFDRRKIIIGSMIGAAASSLWLAWLSHVHGSLHLMYLCLFLGGSASSMGWPARSALLPQIVPAPIFANAAMWNSSFFQISAMVGPALGGLILYWSVAWAYVTAAVFLLLFALFLVFLEVKPSSRRREPITAQSLAAGVRFVFRNQIILATITLDLFAVLLGGATALIPAYARDILFVGPGRFGLLRAAPAVGALLMAVSLAHRPPMKRAGLSLIVAVVGFGAATILFGISRSFVFSFFMLLLTGMFDNVSVVIRHTLLQMLTPDSMRGRVSAVNNVFVGASNELGEFESGMVGHWLGAVPSVVLGGVGTLFVVGTVCLVWPALLRFGSLHDARPVEENEPSPA